MTSLDTKLILTNAEDDKHNIFTTIIYLDILCQVSTNDLCLWVC